MPSGSSVRMRVGASAATLFFLGSGAAWAAPRVFLEDLNGDGEIRILGFGDSLTEGVGDGPEARAEPVQPAGYPARLPGLLGVSVLNGGVGGELTSGGRERIGEALASWSPDFVIIQEGVNDITAGREDEILPNLDAIIEEVFAAGAQPLLGTLLPTCCDRPKPEIPGINEAIRQLASDRGIRLVDFHYAFAPGGTFDQDSGLLHVPEGLHPTVAGYDLMADAAARAFLLCKGRRVTISGTPGDDVLIGTSEADVIHGRGGNDQIDGLGGDDVICGGGGDDVLTGGPGNDRIYGGGGIDTLLGGPADDKLKGGGGDDYLDGEDGNDIVVGGADDDVLHGGEGDDVLRGKSGIDDLDGGLGTDACEEDPEDTFANCE